MACTLTWRRDDVNVLKGLLIWAVLSEGLDVKEYYEM